MSKSVPAGWNALGDRIAVNPDPLLGGIIDKVMFSDEWFIVFNADDLDMIDGLTSREEAFEVFEKTISAKYK